MSLSYLLQLIDRYPIAVQVKGSYAVLAATKIIVTTNIHPLLWYDYARREGQYKALARRFTKVSVFPGKLGAVQVPLKVFFDDWFENCDEKVLFAGRPDAVVVDLTDSDSDSYSDSEVFDEEPLPDAQPEFSDDLWSIDPGHVEDSFSDTEFV